MTNFKQCKNFLHFFEKILRWVRSVVRKRWRRLDQLSTWDAVMPSAELVYSRWFTATFV